MEKIFVIIRHSEYQDYPASSQVIGAYKELTDAETELERAYSAEVLDWYSSHEEDETDERDYGFGDRKYFLDTNNNTDYVELSIQDVELR